MSVTILSSTAAPSDQTTRFRSRVYNQLKSLVALNGTEVSSKDDNRVILIENNLQYVPDFRLVWCDVKKHFRVYIDLAYTDTIVKNRSGYPICTIPNSLVLFGFAVMYQFLHKNRANKKA